MGTYESCVIADGGGKRDRTADLLHAMQALSQLSYTPKRARIIMIEPTLVEQISRNCTADWKLNHAHVQIESRTCALRVARHATARHANIDWRPDSAIIALP